MSKLFTIRVFCVLPLLQALSACGAGAEGDLLPEGSVDEAASLASDPSEAQGPELGRLQEALSTGVIEDTVGFGFDVSGKDHDVVAGRTCDQFFQRRDAPQLTGDTCRFDGWVSTDVTDCRFNLHAHTNAWSGGACHFRIVEQRRPSSCRPTSRESLCGGVGADGVCYCDVACTTIGDCCPDYSLVCR